MSMTVHEKTGAGVVAGKHPFAVEMTVRVVVAAASPEDALEQSINTANWVSWQWVGPRTSGADE